MHHLKQLAHLSSVHRAPIQKTALFVSFCAILLVDLKSEEIIIEVIDVEYDDDSQLNSGNDNNNIEKKREYKNKRKSINNSLSMETRYTVAQYIYDEFEKILEKN